MRRPTFSALTLVLLLGIATSAAAQQIVLDRPVRAGELTLFPGVGDENTYFYLLDKARLGTHEDGTPAFSFVQYVENQASTAADPLLDEGTGGGIVHALVTLEVTQGQLREAERELRRVNPDGRIQGPVMYSAGRFALISSFADASGDLTERVLGVGTAPILDNQSAAVSIQLTRKGAELLWASFETSTPDVSFSFEMDVEGYLAPKRASIHADFERIYEHHGFSAGVASTYLSAEIKGAFDDLHNSGAIRVEQVGEDAKMEELLTTAYNKLTEMMFNPVGGSGTDLASLTSAAGGRPSVLDRATTLLEKGRADARAENTRIRARNERAAAERQRLAAERDAAQDTEGATAAERSTLADRQAGLEVPTEEEAARPNVSHREAAAAEAEGPEDEDLVSVPSIAVVAMYEMKRVKQTGDFDINLNKYTSTLRTLRFDENIGDLTGFLDDERVFKRVNLDDPLYRQREIVASIDGLNADDFGDYVNFVTVHMEKRHENGDVTHDEVRIGRDDFNREGNAFKMLYGWKGDDDRDDWLDYRYRTRWSFFGGQAVEEPWRDHSVNSINLAPPYQPRSVTLEADPETLEDADVRLVTVKIFYDLAGAEKVRQVTLKPALEEASRRVDFMLPADRYDYDYEISWRLRGNRSVTTGRRSSNESVLFVDELPEA